MMLIEVSRSEYESFSEDVKSTFKKKSDILIDRFPNLVSKKEFFDEMYSEFYAEMKKDESGYCVNLDQKTMLCSIYENRPSVCGDFKKTRCKDIRELCTN